MWSLIHTIQTLESSDERFMQHLSLKMWSYNRLILAYGTIGA
nr:MAG TPA: hypothetical protein [Caudoviricetes sp.]